MLDSESRSQAISVNRNPPINGSLSTPRSNGRQAFWSGSVTSGDLGELYYAVPMGQLYRYPVVASSCSNDPNGGNPPVCNGVAHGNDNVIPVMHPPKLDRKGLGFC